MPENVKMWKSHRAPLWKHPLAPGALRAPNPDAKGKTRDAPSSRCSLGSAALCQRRFVMDPQCWGPQPSSSLPDRCWVKESAPRGQRPTRGESKSLRFQRRRFSGPRTEMGRTRPQLQRDLPIKRFSGQEPHGYPSPSPQHARASGRATLQRAGALPSAVEQPNAFQHGRRLRRHLTLVITNPASLPQLCF